MTKKQRFGLWLALAAIAIPLLFVSPAQGITPDPTPTESPSSDPTAPPDSSPDQTPDPSSSFPSVLPPMEQGCIPGESVIVSHGGFTIGAITIREDGCTRQYWEFVDLCPANIPNPNYTPPELRGYESEPDPNPQPEFINAGCYLMAAYRLQYSEEINP